MGASRGPSRASGSVPDLMHPAERADPGVAVVLATRDRPALLEGALEALRRALRPEDEAVVVDSASRDPAVSRIAERSGFPVVRLDRPGTSRARNAGVVATRAPVIAFTDDDCLVRPGWTERIQESFEDRSIGFLMGGVVADRATPAALAVTEDLAYRRLGKDVDPAELAGGSNMSFRRTAFEEVRGFDEAMGPGARFRAAEDQDLFWRVLQAGWIGISDPSIVVTHRQWRRLDAAILRQYVYGVGAGALATKMIRLGSPHGKRYLMRRLWTDGIAFSARSLARWYRSGVPIGLLKASGVLAGTVRAWRAPMEGSRFGA